MICLPTRVDMSDEERKAGPNKEEENKNAKDGAEFIRLKVMGQVGNLGT